MLLDQEGDDGCMTSYHYCLRKHRDIHTAASVYPGEPRTSHLSYPHTATSHPASSRSCVELDRLYQELSDGVTALRWYDYVIYALALKSPLGLPSFRIAPHSSFALTIIPISRRPPSVLTCYSLHSSNADLGRLKIICIILPRLKLTTFQGPLMIDLVTIDQLLFRTRTVRFAHLRRGLLG